MKKRKMICPTCHQDMDEPPHQGMDNKDCPQCGQGISWRRTKEEKKIDKAFKQRQIAKEKLGMPRRIPK